MHSLIAPKACMFYENIFPNDQKKKLLIFIKMNLAPIKYLLLL